MWGIGWWLFTRLDRQTGEFYLERILAGSDLAPRSPMLAFRKRVLSAAASGERLNEREQLALLISGWNKFRANEEVALLKIPVGGAIPKPY